MLGEGFPEPLGVTPRADGVNVAVVSGCATAIDLCLFDATGAERRLRLPGRTGDVFHGHIPGVAEGDLYGLRAHGPWDPARGLRFDPTKLLVDPHAVALDRPFQLHPFLFTGPDAGLDSAAHVPKARVAAPAPPSGPLRQVTWGDTVIYEALVRGLSALHPQVPPSERGRFAGLGHPAVVEHLKALGVTTLELLPVAAWVDERHLPPLGLANAWGYNPAAFGAPDPRLAPGGWAEVRQAVAALADAGIEVILDVVFNHSGESDALGPTLSLRGLDNPGYYRLDPGDPAAYVNDAGTGNILRCDAPQVVRLVLDSLRTWVRRGGVAGFRFDLATVLGRRSQGFDPAAPLLSAIAQDPELRGLKLIAEPWDCGPGGHQTGRFPTVFAEWNDRYRDAVRRFWGPHGGTRGELAARLAGSADLFHAKRRPSRSLNYVTAHDGFTLADLVSYAEKHNLANGENGRDGSDGDASWNNGVEGETAEPDVQARRAADQAALLATLLLSRGTPMLSMGAELGRTQAGNNNAYAQDNALNWIDWGRADPAQIELTARLTAARRAHPALRTDRFLTGASAGGDPPDVGWFDAEGAPLGDSAWDGPAGAVLQMALAVRTDTALDRVVVVFNRGNRPTEVRLPESTTGAWRIVANTADPQRHPAVPNPTLAVAGRSVLLLAEASEPRRRLAAPDQEVARLADAAGLETRWWTLAGEARQVSPESQRALLGAMGFPAATRSDVRDSLAGLAAAREAPLPAVQVITAGAAARLPVRGPERWLTLVEPGGETRHFPVLDGAAALPPRSAGAYRVQLGACDAALIAAPERAYEPEPLANGARRFGVSAQVYALRRAGDQGLGDLTSLAQLGAALDREGAALLAINPLHALFPQDRSRASPYHPSDRRFLDPLYIDVARLGAAPPPPVAAGAPLDYDAAWACKSNALAAALAGPEPDPAALAAFRRRGGEPLRRFAIFQALAEVHPGPWSAWPADLRDPTGPAVRRFAQQKLARVAWHERLQFHAERQLAAAAAAAPGFGLCRDLAVGAAPDGAEVWAAQENWAQGASIGAPPDAFAVEGQVWGLPPPRPQRWALQGYAPFAELLRANMRHAGALRIDHMLGLQRLFWIPDGGTAADGAYVRYPFEDLLGVLALESHGARCLVVGEDLGTVPEGFRERIAERAIYGYSVLPFERDGEQLRPPQAYRAKALACAGTHDLPPLAGWWSGEDLSEAAALGRLCADQIAALRTAREADKARLLAALREAGLEPQGMRPDLPFSDALAVAITAFLARSDAQLVLVQAEDMAGIEASQNVPGTDRERANWRTPAPDLVAALAGARAQAMLSALADRQSGEQRSSDAQL